MLLSLLALVVFSSRAVCDEELGFDLNIGNAINVFANYGDLCQVIRVISTEFDHDSDEDTTESSEKDTDTFAEKNLKVFKNATSYEVKISDSFDDMMDIVFCDTSEELFERYFEGFQIEGTNKSWKAFMGDWDTYEILKTFGIYDISQDHCCYVLVKLAKTHETRQLAPLINITLKDYIQRSVDELNANNTANIRQFMKEYGTHYIESYSKGNAIYQVFKYKRARYTSIKNDIRRRGRGKKWTEDTLRYYFSSFFLKQIGNIKVASGNTTVEKWARKNLKDSQYLFSRPTLFKLYYSPILVYKLKNLLDNGALLSMKLKTLKPLFKDTEKRDKYVEIVENDLKLWETNI